MPYTGGSSNGRTTDPDSGNVGSNPTPLTKINQIIKTKKMTFLQVGDTISVTTLPHPISMFFLGVSFIISLYLYFEFTKIRNDIRAMVKENSEIKEKIRNTKVEIDRIVSELSKKVDSRVDKAIESMKKQNHR
jgi:uncharacterized small protein (DUF1192 family)